MRKKLLFVFLLSTGFDYGYAEDLQSVNELTDAESGIDNNAQSRQLLSEQKDRLQSLLSDIDKHYGETAADLKKLQVSIEQKRESLDKIRQDIDDCQSDVQKISKELGEQMRLAYAMGQKEKLKLLFNQDNHALSGRMMVYFNYFNKDRLKKLVDLEAAVKELDELDKQKQAETIVLEQDLESKKSEQAALSEARNQRNDLLAQIGTDSSSTEQQLSQLQESENRMRGLISSLSASEKTLSVDAEQPKQLSTSMPNTNDANADFLSLKGKLPWPVAGKLAHKFGSGRTEGTWDGVLIDANEGVDIKAVTRGKVVFAEWLRGYGLLIIIDHGQGYMTLYAFNQSLYKQLGDMVEAGDVIASVGQSGGRNKAGLYFGIRSKGVPIDPIEWCRK
ncbi:MAG: peptidoglycan DD-metalloendopeptidase family protein [Methylococcales bacterium]|nr:peptidoglycan DD-metalloendopeptidase family protein [Methylococcales bacterium]